MTRAAKGDSRVSRARVSNGIPGRRPASIASRTVWLATWTPSAARALADLSTGSAVGLPIGPVENSSDIGEISLVESTQCGAAPEAPDFPGFGDVCLGAAWSALQLTLSAQTAFPC
jgi:hypothetical protein